MKHKELDTIKITTNAYNSSDGIEKGRWGAIVTVYSNAYEVEFMTTLKKFPHTRTDALLTLKEDEVEKV